MSFPQISTNDREKILRHNWWGHDGRWYLFVAKELGFDKANEMNMKINKAIGKLEIKNIMAISGIDEILIKQNLIQFLRMNLELCAKDVFNLEDFLEEGNSIIFKVSNCPAHSGTQKAGYISDYQCACFKRCEGWLEAIGLTYNSFIRKSLMKGDKFCEIVMTPDK